MQELSKVGKKGNRSPALFFFLSSSLALTRLAWVTRTRTRTLELLLYNLSRLRLLMNRFFLEAARVLEVARIRCFLVCQNV
nr:hypothetical protein CFP56_66633 [Quercus suber]